MSLRYPSHDTDLKTIVRDETSYEDTADELPSSQLDTIVEQAKAKVELTTGSSSWYSDDGLGFALAAYTKMRAKAAVENIALGSYQIGDEQVTFNTDDPEDSQQLQQWAEDVRDGLDASTVDTNQGLVMRNSTSYIGDDYVEERSL